MKIFFAYVGLFLGSVLNVFAIDELTLEKDIKVVQSALKRNFKTYQGKEGYLQLSIQYFKGDMDYTYKVAYLALSSRSFNKLQWEMIFNGTSEEFSRIRNAILYKGKIRSEYIGKEGLVRFASQNFPNNLHGAIVAIKSGLAKSRFEKLKWIEEKNEITKQLESKQSVKNDLLVQIQEKKSTKSTKDTVSELKDSTKTQSEDFLTELEFIRKGWKEVSSIHLNNITDNEVKMIRDELLDSKGKVKLEYRHPQGLELLLDEPLAKEFSSTSEFLAKIEFSLYTSEINSLNWDINLVETKISNKLTKRAISKLKSKALFSPRAAAKRASKK